MTETEFNKLKPNRQKDEMMSFCLKKGVKIYLHPLTGTKGKIAVEDNGRVMIGKIIYNTSKKRKEKDPKWENAIRKGYEHYYNKLNKDE